MSPRALRYLPMAIAVSGALFTQGCGPKLDPGLSTLMYVQPFSGFILNSGDLFVQGFTSMTLRRLRMALA